MNTFQDKVYYKVDNGQNFCRQNLRNDGGNYPVSMMENLNEDNSFRRPYQNMSGVDGFVPSTGSQMTAQNFTNQGAWLASETPRVNIAPSTLEMNPYPKNSNTSCGTTSHLQQVPTYLMPVTSNCIPRELNQNQVSNGALNNPNSGDFCRQNQGQHVFMPNIGPNDAASAGYALPSQGQNISQIPYDSGMKTAHCLLQQQDCQRFVTNPAGSGMHCASGCGMTNGQNSLLSQKVIPLIPMQSYVPHNRQTDSVAQASSSRYQESNFSTTSGAAAGSSMDSNRLATNSVQPTPSSVGFASEALPNSTEDTNPKIPSNQMSSSPNLPSLGYVVGSIFDRICANVYPDLLRLPPALDEGKSTSSESNNTQQSVGRITTVPANGNIEADVNMQPTVQNAASETGQKVLGKRQRAKLARQRKKEAKRMKKDEERTNQAKKIAEELEVVKSLEAEMNNQIVMNEKTLSNDRNAQNENIAGNEVVRNVEVQSTSSVRQHQDRPLSETLPNSMSDTASTNLSNQVNSLGKVIGSMVDRFLSEIQSRTPDLPWFTQQSVVERATVPSAVPANRKQSIQSVISEKKQKKLEKKRQKAKLARQKKKEAKKIIKAEKAAEAKRKKEAEEKEQAESSEQGVMNEETVLNEEAVRDEGDSRNEDTAGNEESMNMEVQTDEAVARNVEIVESEKADDINVKNEDIVGKEESMIMEIQAEEEIVRNEAVENGEVVESEVDLKIGEALRSEKDLKGGEDLKSSDTLKCEKAVGKEEAEKPELKLQKTD